MFSPISPSSGFAILPFLPFSPFCRLYRFILSPPYCHFTISESFCNFSIFAVPIYHFSRLRILPADTIALPFYLPPLCYVAVFTILASFYRVYRFTAFYQYYIKLRSTGVPFTMSEFRRIAIYRCAILSFYRLVVFRIYHFPR